jgi:hypothetical protein
VWLFNALESIRGRRRAVTDVDGNGALSALRAFAARQGYELVDQFYDAAVSPTLVVDREIMHAGAHSSFSTRRFSRRDLMISIGSSRAGQRHSRSSSNAS